MKRRLLPVALAALLVLAALVSLTLGRYPVSVGEILAYFGRRLFNLNFLNDADFKRLGTIIMEIRLPRIVAALLAGAALSVSGTAFQAMFINPLASPGLLGVLAGASFGAALGMMISTKWLLVQVSAFVFGLTAAAAAVVMAEFYKGDRLLLLILSGVVSGSFFTALLSIIKYLADPYDQLPAITYWLMGGFYLVDHWTAAAAGPPMILGMIVIFILSKYLNVLTMGDEEARTLGVRVKALRLSLILAATLISSLTVAVGGVIGWVGLIIPHAGRLLIGPDNIRLIPVSALLGATFLLLVDDVSRLLFPVEIPIGILTALLGIPFFAVILKNARQGWS
ncbi:MAG: iron ABC transporter permease [Pseudomonadota bacterium]